MSESVNTAIHKSLKPEILQLLKTDEGLVFKISKSMRKKFRTIEKWIRDEDGMLTSDAVILLIRDYTGLTESQILTEAKEPVT